MTNVIVDAGTDAKIAKFQKRGIELIDLALLEPVEVWGEGGRERDARRESMRIVADEMGASVVVNAGGGREGAGILSPKSQTGLLQPEGPVNHSATSSATSLHSQNAHSTTQTPISQHLVSQTMTTDHYTPTAASDTFPIFHSNSNSGSSNNQTSVPPVSASLTSMSLAMMSPPASPAPGPVSGKRKLFNKLFNKKQNNSNLFSPSESGSPGQQWSFAQSQSPPTITTTGSNSPDSELSPPPTFASFTLSPAPVTNKTISTADRSFSSRSNSMKRRSAPPPALIEPVPVSPFAMPELTSPGLGVAVMTPPIEQQTTPTQMSVAAGGAKTKTKTKTNTITSPSTPTPWMVEVPIERERETEKSHGRGVSLVSITSPFRSTLKSRLSSVVIGGGGGLQSSSQVRDSGSNIDNFPTPSNMKGSDRDSSPHPTLGSNDKSRSRSSLVCTSSTNDSADSHGGGGFTAIGNFGTGGIGQVPPAQAEIMMNLRQQQLQLRPPILGIQPTFVSSNPSSASSNLNPSNPFSLDGASTTTTENTDQLFGQRALMYVWLVRRWMKKRSSGLSGLSGLGDSAVGFLGDVVGGLKGDKEKDKRKEKVKDKNKRKSSADFRPGSSHGGLATVTAPLMYGGVEVRFEWKRARAKEKGGSRKKKSRSGRGRTGMQDGRGESDGEVGTSMERDDPDERGSIRGGAPLPKTKERLKSEEKKKYRMSTGSISSIAANSVIDGGEFETKKGNQYDDGEDSDPEDSETPWICTLKLRRGATAVGGSPTAGGTQPQPPILQTQVLRIKVGTVSPTPHHPKVVAMLKVPFPLPDIEVEKMGVIKRQGVIPPQNSTYNGLVLTAEEIKDVVCSTGIWLVVREGFGGVGRVNRKGDGWRIRA